MSEKKVEGDRRYYTHRKAILENYCVLNNHTKVQHWVGLYKDSFGNDKGKNKIYSLENKLCFRDRGMFHHKGIGRGGGGRGTFVCAILDWQRH